MDRSIIYSQEQPRSYDILEGWRQTLYALAWLEQDLTGAQTAVVSGFAATQTASPSLLINLAQGRIYQLADVDATAYGALSADLTQVMQQGNAAAQQVTLTTAGIGAGQSQYALVQAKFSPLDDIPATDPTGGVLNFQNPSPPPAWYIGPGGNGAALNTQRLGTVTIGVVYGAAATTGSEVPPNATSGYVGMYLVDLVYGQTTITTGEILTAGPSVGTGVPSNYPACPTLAGLLNQHHKGTTGQAPQIDLTAEVKNKLPMANLVSSSAVTANGAGIGTLYAYAGNPNSHLPGVAAVAGVSPCDFCIDTTDQVLYYCSTTGNASGAVWTNVSNSSSVSSLHQVVYGSTSAGSANAQTVTDSPVLTAYTAGQLVVFIAGASNTGATTINCDGLGAKGVYKPGSSGPVALSGAEIITGNIIVIIYDGTHFQLVVSIPATAPSQQQLNVWGGTSGGSANAQTVTDTPALTGLNVGQIITFLAGFENTGACTLNPDSLGAKNIYKLGPNGAFALGGGEITAGAMIQVQYDGTQFRLLSGEYKAAPVGGARRNLVVTNDATNANTQIDITADELILEDQYGQTVRGRSLSVTIASGTSGAGGLDTGSVANSTPYFLYVIYNPSTQTFNGLMSLSATSPTLPSGYTFSRRVSWQRTDGSARFYRITQTNDRASYRVNAGAPNTNGLPIIGSGTAGSISVPTWVALSLVGIIPSTAIELHGIATANDVANTNIILAPNNAYGAIGSTTNPPPLQSSSASDVESTIPFEMLPESTNVYWASNSSVALVAVTGWRDNI